MKNSQTLTLETITFEKCFGVQRTISKIEAIEHDNREYIKEYGTVADYIWSDIAEGDQQEHNWMTDECSDFYQGLSDSAEKAMVTDLLHDFIFERYNYTLE